MRPWFIHMSLLLDQSGSLTSFSTGGLNSMEAVQSNSTNRFPGTKYPQMNAVELKLGTRLKQGTMILGHPVHRSHRSGTSIG